MTRLAKRIAAMLWAAALLFAAPMAVADDETAEPGAEGPAVGADATLARWDRKDLGAEWVTLERAQILFAGATGIDPLDGTPPAVPVYVEDRLEGYMFRTIDAARSLGFSSQPFYIAVGLRLDGTLSGIDIIEHNEPIIDLYMLQERVPRFVSQFAGIDIRKPVRVRTTRKVEPGTIDGISAATISAVLFNDAVINAARKVALGRGFSLSDEPMVDLIDFEQKGFEALIADGSVARLHVTESKLAGTPVSDPDLATNEQLLGLSVPRIDDETGEALITDLYFAPVTAPTIGRNLFGERKYNMFVSGRDHRDLMVLLMARGPYLFDQHKLQVSGTLDRVRVVQDGQQFPLTREKYRFINFLPGKDKPDFTQIGLYWLKAEEGIDPLAPWRLELEVADRNGVDGTVVGMDYALAETYIVRPTAVAADPVDSGPIWLAAWHTQSTNIAILVAALIVLTGILLFMEPLTRRPKLFSAIRLGYLAFVLVWLGWIAGAQVTIINVLTWLQAAVGDFSFDVFMSDPLIAVLIIFVVVTFVLWGRGVFCGWLCPFGALQELLAKAARALRLPEWRPSHRVHRMLWPVKYAVLAVLVVLSFVSMVDAGKAAEVEPFKTAISLYFVREWPYVLYAVTLLAIGLFVERFFCRFVCPLGAAMAVGGLLRVRPLTFLRRREECGSPCQLCARKCPIQAIEPGGKINMNECFYCLDCQVAYYDEHVCPPLVAERKRRERSNEHPVPASATA